jgi:hypothetical protein
VKSYEIGTYTFSPDCTHAIAILLERIYKNQEAFKDFTAQCANLRKKWNMSQFAAYMPPNQRSKVRFANIIPVVNWAYDTLQIPIEQLPKEVADSYEYLYSKREWLNEFWQIGQMVEQISKLLKIEGFSLKNKEKIEELGKDKKGIQIQVFCEKISEYMNELQSKLGDRTNLLCCSDVIESAFGKFKFKINQGSTYRMTEFILTIANFGRDFTQDEVKEALTKVKLKDLKEKGSKAPSLVAKRRDIFNKNGGKKAVGS